MKTLTQARCEQFGVCQTYGTCTQCLVASQRHPFAPGVIQASPESRSFTIAVRCLAVLAAIVLGAAIVVGLDLSGLYPSLWLLAA